MFIKIVIGIIAALLLGFIIYGLYNPLSISQVTVSSDKIDNPIRIALISDLHSCKYGDSQMELISAIESQDPDLICLSGDIFDDKISDDNTETFLEGISEKYPCYYVTGNHECRSGTTAFQKKMSILEKCGVTRLSNESAEIEVNGQKLYICGVEDPKYSLYENEYHISNALFSIKNALPDNVFTLLLSHRPEYFSLYTDYGYDLTLCGHAHGGQWRIPGILNHGLLAPDQGFFPKYTTGEYISGASTMVVSRGLAKESTIVPRFYNKPEIVIIEVQ